MSKNAKIIAGIIAVAVVVAGAYLILKPKADPYKDIDTTSVTSVGQIYFGTINMIKINETADALKALADQRVKYSEQLNKEAKKKEEELIKAKKEIEQKQAVLAKDVLEKKVNEYQQSVMNFQKDIQEKAQSIENNYREALQNVQETYLNDIIETIAKKKEITVILNSAQIISLNPALDITDDVIKVLNQKVKKVSMKTPKGM